MADYHEVIKNLQTVHGMPMTIRLAIEALEKQTPKKPKKYIAFDGIKRNGCPACDHNEILYGGQRYCSVCGQAIDWSDE